MNFFMWGEYMYERIKKLCRENGMTIPELEERAGISSGAISHWRSSSPKAQNVLSVAQVLECSVDYLLTGEIEKSPAPKEGEAGLDELTRLFSAADPWIQDQVLSLLRAAESAKQAPGGGK